MSAHTPDTSSERLAEIRVSVAGDAAAPPGYDISQCDLAERADLQAMLDAMEWERRHWLEQCEVLAEQRDSAQAECREIRAQLSACMAGDGGRTP